MFQELTYSEVTILLSYFVWVPSSMPKNFACLVSSGLEQRLSAENVTILARDHQWGVLLRSKSIDCRPGFNNFERTFFKIGLSWRQYSLLWYVRFIICGCRADSSKIDLMRTKIGREARHHGNFFIRMQTCPLLDPKM